MSFCAYRVHSVVLGVFIFLAMVSSSTVYAFCDAGDLACTQAEFQQQQMRRQMEEMREEQERMKREQERMTWEQERMQREMRDQYGY